MRKLFIAVILLALLAGVVYLKSLREEQSQARTFKQGRRQGLSESDNWQRRADSLDNLVSGVRKAMTDSLSERDRRYAAGVDSLSALIVERETLLTQLQDENRGGDSSGKTAVIRKKSEAGGDRHHEILAYYKKAIDELPDDLSPYEQRVATSEIRQLTAKKYNVTVARLNQIRKQYEVDY